MQPSLLLDTEHTVVKLTAKPLGVGVLYIKLTIKTLGGFGYNMFY